MKKSELIKHTANISGMSQDKTSRVLNAALSAMSCHLISGGQVQLAGFGVFSVSNRAARPGINPKTGASLQRRAHRAVKFSAYSALKEAMN